MPCISTLLSLIGHIFGLLPGMGWDFIKKLIIYLSIYRNLTKMLPGSVLQITISISETTEYTTKWCYLSRESCIDSIIMGTWWNSMKEHKKCHCQQKTTNYTTKQCDPFKGNLCNWKLLLKLNFRSLKLKSMEYCVDHMLYALRLL